jgi:uncharacterized protein involved in cysteine biosynthesis
MQPPDPEWLTWLDRLGWPLFFLIALIVCAFFSLRRLWSWFQPHLDKIIESHVKRNESIANSMKELAEKTIKIQEANSETLTSLNKKLPDACKWKPSKK